MNGFDSGHGPGHAIHTYCTFFDLEHRVLVLFVLFLAFVHTDLRIANHDDHISIWYAVCWPQFFFPQGAGGSDSKPRALGALVALA